jgi:hypothetical protein
MDLPEERDMDHLLNSLEQHERKGEPYNFSGGGFVFTATQIHTARLRPRSL